jgi:hypothetical protein
LTRACINRPQTFDRQRADRTRQLDLLRDNVEEEIEGDISGEHWGLDMGEKSTTRKLDSWGEIKAE